MEPLEVAFQIKEAGTAGAYQNIPGLVITGEHVAHQSLEGDALAALGRRRQQEVIGAAGAGDGDVELCQALAPECGLRFLQGGGDDGIRGGDVLVRQLRDPRDFAVIIARDAGALAVDVHAAVVEVGEDDDVESEALALVQRHHLDGGGAGGFADAGGCGEGGEFIHITAAGVIEFLRGAAEFLQASAAEGIQRREVMPQAVAPGAQGDTEPLRRDLREHLCGERCAPHLLPRAGAAGAGLRPAGGDDFSQRGHERVLP